MKIFKYVLYDVLRSRMVAAYCVLLFLLSLAVFWFGGDNTKSVVSLLHLVLLVVPLVSVIFGTIHYYNSREFIELLLAQPVTRNKVFFSQYLGVTSSLIIAFLFGVGAPMLIHQVNIEGLYLLAVGALLTLIFTALAYMVSIRTNDKAKGMGASLLLWFYFAVLFDGIVLFILFYFNDYPLEKTVLVLTALNPIDLGRVLSLLQFDTAALMGYTGALYQKFFGTSLGLFYSFVLMFAWLIWPLTVSRRLFLRKDF